ncbi:MULTISPECIES: hypothetical protein [Mesotoga]|uniref:hypothetical protein n=1 Tax=Mesotoga TaxID=1184396 RepID=UPI000A92AC4E|nr:MULTISPECIES: hypothetical protein [Mesotoga]MCP5456969.1 hypothetical protein [Thermotogota bacterium]HOP37336.1 hypothetical protein [Mesotoga prima]HPQ91064.1 hypothetical protein [Mesotoga prima]HQN60354.1 hypothetical protein [Mesotoga prima]HUM21569.1 hypothetical protein [Mesotoga prima]
MKAAYRVLNTDYVCLTCEMSFKKGEVFGNPDEVLIDAEMAAKEHRSRNRVSPFHSILMHERNYTGLSEHQQTMIAYSCTSLGNK